MNSISNISSSDIYPPLKIFISFSHRNIEKKKSVGKSVVRQSGFVESLRKSAPVLVLQNKTDVEEGKLDQKVLVKDYENIVNFYNLSLTTGKRTGIILEILDDFLRTMNLSGRQLVSYEFDIIEHYIKNSKKFRVISLKEFLEEYNVRINKWKISQLKEIAEIKFDEENAHILAEILNAIGIFYYDNTGKTDGMIYTKISYLNELIKQVMEVAKGVSADGKNFFDYKDLKKKASRGIYEYSSHSKMFSINDFKHIADFENLPKKLFISYSSKNSEFIKRFVTHLEVLKSAGLIDPWYDRMIESGTKWDDTIRNEMKTSDVIIFLLSPDFLATEYIMKTEIPLAIAQMQDQRSKFFFVELQPCGWKRTDIAQYQQTDDSGEKTKDVIVTGWPDNDRQWNKVIDELEQKMAAANSNE